MTQLNQDEKIDYIYNYIKTEKRNRIFKIFFKIFLIIAIFYAAQYIINNIWTDQIKKTISSEIWDITSPIIRDLVEDLDKSSIKGIKKQLILDTIKNDPEILNKIKNYDY